MKNFSFLIFYLFIFVNISSLKASDTIAKNDTVLQENVLNRKSPKNSFKSPTSAVLRSLVLPGLGQIYVEKYWKAPLFFVGAGVMYYYVFKHQKDYIDYSKKYDELKNENPNDLNLYFFKLKRENALDNRDISIFLLFGIYALSMLDAYVDAHLFNFNVDEQISVNIGLNPNRLGFVFSFCR
ncbi:MAG: DUF5683 domain-containing protein [Candidatus Kapaibacteriales bacterium]